MQDIYAGAGGGKPLSKIPTGSDESSTGPLAEWITHLACNRIDRVRILGRLSKKQMPCGFFSIDFLKTTMQLFDLHHLVAIASCLIVVP